MPSKAIFRQSIAVKAVGVEGAECSERKLGFKLRFVSESSVHF